MKVGEFRKYTDALARFATTREKAQGIESLVGVQKKGNTLKLISGNSRAGMVVTVEEFSGDTGDFSYVVPARPLLQASKVLPTKASITLYAQRDGLHIQAEGGGMFDIGDLGMSLRDAGFPKKPKKFRVKGELDAETLKRIAKLFKNVSAKVEVPCVRIVNGTAYAIAVAPGERPMYVNYRFDATSAEGDDDEYSMAGYRDFWEGLTHFTESGTIYWGRDGILVRSANAECYSAPYLVSSWDEKTRTAGPPEEQVPWPIMVAIDKSDVAITVKRKVLSDAVKSQAPFDEHNRVTLEANAGSLRVSPFGSSDGMDIESEAKGKGIRSVNADHLLTLLNAMDTKDVTLRWSGGVPAISISAEDYRSWTILLAPVAL